MVDMAGADVSGGLRDALIDNLNNILSPQAEVRRAAEEQIHVLEVTEGEEEDVKGEERGGKKWREGGRGGVAEHKDLGLFCC